MSSKQKSIHVTITTTEKSKHRLPIFILYIPVLLFSRKCHLIEGHVIISFTISCPSPFILVIPYLNLKNNIFKSVI